MRLRERLKRLTPLVAIVRHCRALATPLGRGRLSATRRGAQFFQPATVTRMDRHPILFRLVTDALATRPAPRLLSFGCSTGEEAFTLARHLPGAAIDAVDANPACIARARRTGARLHPGRIRSACADRPDALTEKAYDAIFCLSVLRHGDLDALRPDVCSAILPFARFAEAVDAFDRMLRPGGLIVLWGCNFRFADTTIADRYRPLATPGVRPQSGPFYGPDDRRSPEEHYASFVFVKRA